MTELLRDRKARACLLATIAVMLPASAYAQQSGTLASSPPPTSAAIQDAQTSVQDERQSGVGDIIVTAQRRGENLQSVPIAVSAMSAESLVSTGVATTAELSVVVPGLNYQQNLGFGTPYIRGVGTSSNQAGQENPVATYVDGVYLPSSTSTIMDFNNVERVEVLRGPQGTLFGRNSSGGVIQIVTRTPSLTSRVLEGALSYGNYEAVKANAYVSVPLADTLAFDVAAIYRYQGRGYGRNVTTGNDYQKGTSFGVTSKLYWEPTSATKLTLGLMHNESDGSFGGGYIAVSPLNFGLKYNDVRGNVDPNVKQNVDIYTLNAQWQIGGVALTSITAYQNINSGILIDADGVDLLLINGLVLFREKVFSQEFQVSSRGSGPFVWTAGLYYWHDNAFGQRNLSGLGFGSPTALLQTNGRQITDSYAAYGQATYSITDNTAFTAGLRYTRDDKRLVDNFHILPNGAFVVQPSTYDNTDTSSKLTWRFSLDHHFNDNVLGYISYNRGFKSGSFNVGEVATPVLRPEVLDSYEAGFKSTFFDRLLRANIAAYYYNYRDLQVLATNAAAQALLQNASSARLYGIEAEFTLAPTRNFNIRSNVSWSPKAEYRDYPSASVGGVVFDASGFRLPKTPKFTGSLGADYTIETGSGDFTATADYYYNGGFFGEANHVLRQSSYNLLNASLTWHLPGNNVSLQVWGKNLTSAKHAASLLTTAFPVFTASPPKTYGIQVGFSF